MPLVQANAVAMLNLFENAKMCMVRISEKVEDKEKRAGNGFVVHCSDDFTVVAVHPSYKFQCLRNGKMYHGAVAMVDFCDGSRATDTAFINLNSFVNLIVARIPLGEWEEAQYGKLSYHTRDKVLSVTSFLNKMVPFVGRVISPQAAAVDRRGDVIPSTANTFTFNLPMAGRMKKDESDDYKRLFEFYKNQVLGSPVFNFSGELVGFVDRCGITFDFKYGRRSEELIDVIHEWLADRSWEEAVESLNRDQRAGGSKKAKLN